MKLNRMLKNFIKSGASLGILLTALSANANPSAANAYIEQAATDAKIPPLLIKAIAWQETGWNHYKADGTINRSKDGGVGIMQLQGGDPSLSEEQNIRAGVAQLLTKWQLNVSPGARVAVDKLGGIPEDYQMDILENWFVPLASYNGYSGTGANGSGGGKGYARAIYGMLATPASYRNWRVADGPQSSVTSAVLPYFQPTVQVTDPGIIGGFNGGNADNIQPYSLCQLVKAGGRIHRYRFDTRAVEDITASLVPRCTGQTNAGGGGSVGNAPKVVLPFGSMPGTTQAFANKLDYKTSACYFKGYHTGVDYAPVSIGQAVMAIAEGRVAKVGQIGRTANSLGSYVVVEHLNLGIRSLYLHVVPNVGVGMIVKAGDKVAAIAATTAVGKHLHLEIQKLEFKVTDDHGKEKLFVGGNTAPIGQCGYVSRPSDLAKGWLNPAEFLKHPVSLVSQGQEQQFSEDLEEDEIPTMVDRRPRVEVVKQILFELTTRGYAYSGSLDEQARQAGLIDALQLVQPQSAASRMEVALFVHRILKKLAPSSLAVSGSRFPIEEFSDAAGASALTYQKTVNELEAAGIVNGAPDSNGELRFYPQRKASATEIQTLISRAMAKVPAPTTDGMQHISDTPADNAVYDGGVSFTKTWQLKNSGTTTWTSAWCLRAQDGPALGAGPVCVVGTVQPNAVYNFRTPMTMPAAQAATVSVRQNWRLENAARVQVGSQVFAVFQTKAKPAGLHVVGPFSMPDSVRVATEVWAGNLKLSGAASQVRMQLTGPQGALVPFSWTAATADQWSLQYRFSTPGDYSWSLTVQGTTGTDTRSGTVKVLSAIVNPPVVTPIAPARVEVGQPWALEVSTSVPAAAVFLQLSGEAAVRLATADNRRFTASRSFNAVGSQAYTVRAMFNGVAAQTLQGSVQVEVAAPPPPPPLPPVALNPVLTRSASVQALQPWSATLRTDTPVYQADLVFKTGRRIPFDGGPVQWATRDENSRFTDAGNFAYELQLRRTASSALEVFPGGVLEVRPAVLPSNPLRISSPSSVEQGQPYNLTLQTANVADKVTVLWPGQAAEQSLQPVDAARTQWAFGNRLFMQAGPQAYSVRSYKDGFTQPTGEAQASLQVTVPNASLRLLEVSRNIIKGEKPYFTVDASLAIARVTVALGNLPTVDLVGGGSNGASQNFRAQVPVAQAGTVAYVITGYNAQGQAAGAPLNGTVAVADVGDALNVPNPVPAEITRGQAVSWMFRTMQAANEMWAEFAAPIGNLPLTGYYLSQTFNYPAGSYAYRVMRRDYLGNVFPIQGAAGTLRIKDAVPVAIRNLSTLPAPGKVGQAMTFSFSLTQPVAVQRADLVFLDINLSEPMAAAAADTWARTRTMAQAGSNRPYRVLVTLADGSRLSQDGAYSVADATALPTAQLQAGPNPGQVSQPVQFAAQLSSAQDVARLELVFPSAGLPQVVQAVPMQQAGANSWGLVQAFASIGSRPSQLKVTMSDGRTAVLGTVVVNTVPASPALLSKVEPATVRVDQTMTFAAQVADPASVARVDIVFTDANVNESMLQTAANVWSRSRPMAQVGANRPYVVRLQLKNGSTTQVGGTYTVTP